MLRDVDLTTMENKKCNEKWKEYSGEVLDSMICARAKGKDACGGDSGGNYKLQQKRKNFYAQISFCINILFNCQAILRKHKSHSFPPFFLHFELLSAPVF